jgi:hypothetical protein
MISQYVISSNLQEAVSLVRTFQMTQVHITIFSPYCSINSPTYFHSPHTTTLTLETVRNYGNTSDKLNVIIKLKKHIISENNLLLIRNSNKSTHDLRLSQWCSSGMWQSFTGRVVLTISKEHRKSLTQWHGVTLQKTSIFKIMLIQAEVKSMTIHKQVWPDSLWTYLNFSVPEWMCHLNATSTSRYLRDSSLCNRSVSLCYQDSNIYHFMPGRSSQWPW